jgi:hypothetical protein
MSYWCWPHQDNVAVVRLRSAHHDRQIELFIMLCGWSRYLMAPTKWISIYSCVLILSVR